MIEPETKILCDLPRHDPYDLMIVWDGSVMAQVGKVTVISGVTYHGMLSGEPMKVGSLFYVKDGKTSYISDKHILYFGPYEKAFDKRHKVQETRKEDTDDTV